MQNETPMTLYARKLVAEKGPIKAIGNRDVECVADGWAVKVRQLRKHRYFQLSRGKFIWSEKLQNGITSGGLVVMGTEFPETLAASDTAFAGKPVNQLMQLPAEIAAALSEAAVTKVKYRPKEGISPSFLTVEYIYN